MILLWDTDHRQWVSEFAEKKKYWFSVLLSDFLGTAVRVALILLDLDWFGMTELVRRGNTWPTQTLHRRADVKISRISLVIWTNVSFIINLSVNFWTSKVVDAYSCLNLHTVDAFLFVCFSLKTTAKCFECQILTCSVDLLLPLSWDCGCWRWAFLSFIICYRWKLLRNVYIYWGENVNDWNSMILKWKCTFIDFP